MHDQDLSLFERRDVRGWTLIAIVACVGLTHISSPPNTPWVVELLGGVSLGLIAMMSVFAPRMLGGDDFV